MENYISLRRAKISVIDKNRQLRNEEYKIGVILFQIRTCYLNYYKFKNKLNLINMISLLFKVQTK